MSRGVWVRGNHVVGELPDLTPAEIAAQQAAAAQSTKVENRIAAVREVRDALKAGTLTFGSAARDQAILKLSRGILLCLRGEIDE